MTGFLLVLLWGLLFLCAIAFDSILLFVVWCLCAIPVLTAILTALF